MRTFEPIGQVKFNFQESFCIAIAITIGTCIDFAFNLGHGYWIPMTIALMFAYPSQGAIVQRAYDRIIGTFIGVFFGYLFVATLLYSDYRWAYILPLIWFFMFYVNWISNNYCLTVIIITMYVPILFSITSVDPFGIGPTMFKRLACTAFGVLIALICEFTIFKYAAISSRHIKKNTRNYFATVGEITELCILYFIKKQKNNTKLKATIRNMLASTVSLESLYLNIRHEFNYSDEQKDILTYLMAQFEKINYHLRKLLSLSSNDSIDKSYINTKEFEILAGSVAFRYKNIVKFMPNI